MVIRPHSAQATARSVGKSSTAEYTDCPAILHGQYGRLVKIHFGDDLVASSSVPLGSHHIFCYRFLWSNHVYDIFEKGERTHISCTVSQNRLIVQTNMSIIQTWYNRLQVYNRLLGIMRISWSLCPGFLLDE